ncbi:MAG: hypothetical protein EOO39_46645, partial [Cytophagaceae bacterium]
MGNILKESVNDEWIANAYDVLSNRIKTTSSLGADITHQYNQLGDVIQTEANGWAARFGYDKLGLETERILPGNVVNKWQRDGIGRPVMQEVGQKAGAVFNRRKQRQYTWDVNDRLSLAYSLVVSRTNRNLVSGENSSRGEGVTSAVLVAPPTVAPLDANGNYSNVVPYTFSPNVLRNPLALAREVDNQTQRDYTLANIALNYQLLTGLVFRTSIGIESDKTKGNLYSSRRLTDLTPTGSAQQSYADQLNVLNENTLTYTKTLADRHNLTALGGFTYQKQTNQGFSASATGFANDNLKYYSLQAGSAPGIPNSSYSDWSLLSYLGRLNYSFADKYLLTASLRADGSSRFGENNKWGYF